MLPDHDQLVVDLSVWPTFDLAITRIDKLCPAFRARPVTINDSSTLDPLRIGCQRALGPGGQR